MLVNPLGKPAWENACWTRQAVSLSPVDMTIEVLPNGSAGPPLLFRVRRLAGSPSSAAGNQTRRGGWVS